MLFKGDAALPTREQFLIGISIALVHFLLVAWLVRVVGFKEAGADDRTQGDGAALSVTFVTLAPSVQPAPFIPVSAPTPTSSISENGTGGETTRADDVAGLGVPALAEDGEQANAPDSSLSAVEAARQIAPAAATAAVKDGSAGHDLLAGYHAALRASIRRKWFQLTDRPFPSGCALQLNLAIGGKADATSAATCAIAQVDRFHLEAAVLMAQPLPYAGYESVFAPKLQLTL